MSIEVLRTYRFRCDAYPCTASAEAGEHETPAGWAEVSSTAHQSYAPLPSVKSGAARLRAMSFNGNLTTGRFSLHLCPEHLDAEAALSGHLPHTDGISSNRLILSCSCGARLGEISGGAKSRWETHFAWFLARAQGEQRRCGYTKQHSSHTFMRLEVLFQCPGSEGVECLCTSGSPEMYEGPSRDCPIHGEHGTEGKR